MEKKREIKFRAWDKRKKEMFYDWCIDPDWGENYWWGSDKYFSADVLTEITSSNLNLLTTDPELNLERGTVFLKAVVLGTKSLFYFKNRMFNDQFYIQKDSEYVLLAYKRYLRKAGNSSAVGENRGFVNQLKNYFSDCDKLDSKLLAASYEEKSLVSLFEKYFECTGTSSEFTAKREKVKIETGVVAVVYHSQIGRAHV